MEKKGLYSGSNMEKVLPQEGEPVTDLEKLVYVMRQVTAAAPEVDLPHLQPGLHAYRQVTENVIQNLDSGVFSDPEKMARTMPYFAQLLMDALHHHVHGEKEKTGPWEQMFYDPSGPTMPAYKAMAGFFDTHINRDLAIALDATNTQPEHADDYNHPINAILGSTAHQILDQYVDLCAILKRLKVENIGMYVLVRDLARARGDAWKDFEELRESKIHHGNTTGICSDTCRPHTTLPQTVEQIEESIRNKQLGRMLSTKKLTHHVINLVSRTPEHPWNKKNSIT